MKSFVNIVLLIINVTSFTITMILTLFGIYEQIMGPADAEKLLKKLNIPLSYNQVFAIWIVSIVLMIATYILREKLSGKL